MIIDFNVLQVHDGGTELSPVLGEKFCGLSFPRYLISTQNMVFLKFSTQSGHNNFSLTYFSYPKGKPHLLCNYELKKQSLFTTPKIHLDEAVGLSCRNCLTYVSDLPRLLQQIIIGLTVSIC